MGKSYDAVKFTNREIEKKAKEASKGKLVGWEIAFYDSDSIDLDVKYLDNETNTLKVITVPLVDEDAESVTVVHDPEVASRIVNEVSDHVSKSLRIAFLPQAEAPADLTGSTVIVSERQGGIVAYINDPANAIIVYETLNEKYPSGDPENPNFYGLDFDPADHQADFMKSVKNGEVFRLMNGERPIGYALHNSKDLDKLILVKLD